MDACDHRAIANRMDLFHQQEEGPGMVFWHPRGFALYRVIEDYLRRRMRQAGFAEVRTPQVLARSLWQKSGHWEKFGAHMFALGHEQDFALKPMSCPGHVQIFNKRLRSFRDLPIRLCEFGVCHRDEPSGALSGLMRTRSFVQDDAHIFCGEDHVEAEVARFCRQLRRIYADFGFPDSRVAFSTRPALRAGSDALWDRAETALEGAARKADLAYQTDPGEGAFYGPKLDFFLRDQRGREWQCGAVLGSLERFVGILLEHHGGQLPLWLAPDQIVVATIAPQQKAYALHVVETLAGADLRIVADARTERLSRKIVDAREAGIPILLAVGAREAEDGTVSLRRRGGEQQVMPLGAAADVLRAEARAPA